MRKFGYEELIASAIGIGLFYLALVAQNRIDVLSMGTEHLYMYIPMLIIPIISASFGTFAGLATGVGGLVLSIMLLSRPVQAVEVFNIFIFCLALGSFNSRYKVTEGKFGVKEAVDYNVMQCAMSILTWVFIHPLMSFKILGMDFIEELRKGIRSCFGTALALLVLGTLIMYLISLLYRHINSHRHVINWI